MEAWMPVAGLLALVAMVLAVSYNRFVAQRASVSSTWSGVDVQLQRRHDLIGNLVEVVRGHAAHERTVLEQVTVARAAAVAADRDDAMGPAEQAAAEASLTSAQRQLFAVAEGYPQLQAAASFRDLQAQLVETEDRIAAARRLYNIEVQGLNRRVESFPSNLVAAMFGFERAAWFDAEPPAHDVPNTHP